jgi:DNA-binding SARP family transcriptional activator
VAGDQTLRPVCGRRRKAVLAVLALRAGEIISTDRPVDVVWGDRAPRTAANTLQSHVSYLRRAIGANDAIRTRSPGYLLDLGEDGTDAAVAERLIRLATSAPDPHNRITHLQTALALWRGQPLIEAPWVSWRLGYPACS